MCTKYVSNMYTAITLLIAINITIKWTINCNNKYSSASASSGLVNTINVTDVRSHHTQSPCHNHCHDYSPNESLLLSKKAVSAVRLQPGKWAPTLIGAPQVVLTSLGLDFSSACLHISLSQSHYLQHESLWLSKKAVSAVRLQPGKWALSTNRRCAPPQVVFTS